MTLLYNTRYLALLVFYYGETAHGKMAVLISSNGTETLTKLVFEMVIQGLTCQTEMVLRKLFTEWHLRMSSYSRKDNREEKAFLTPGMVWLCYVYSGGSGRPGVVGVILEWLCSHSWYAKGHTPGWLRCDGHDAGYGKWPRSHSRMPEGRAYYGEAYLAWW